MTRLSSRQIMFYVIYPRIWKIYLVFWKFGNYDAGRGIFAEEFPVYGFDHIIFHNFQPLRRICAEEPFVLVQSPKNLCDFPSRYRERRLLLYRKVGMGPDPVYSL